MLILESDSRKVCTLIVIVNVFLKFGKIDIILILICTSLHKLQTVGVMWGQQESSVQKTRIKSPSPSSARIYRSSFGLVFAKTGSINSGTGKFLKEKARQGMGLFWVLSKDYNIHINISKTIQNRMCLKFYHWRVFLQICAWTSSEAQGPPPCHPHLSTFVDLCVSLNLSHV